jgi:hypothetical protein
MGRIEKEGVMPKERVDGNLPFGPEDGPGKCIVEVGWSRETGHVQVVTKAVNRATGERLSDDEGIHYTDGMYVDLDRRGINDLIHNLRRARDQAFGRDA